MVLTGDNSAAEGPLAMPADILVVPPGRGTASITGGKGPGMLLSNPEHTGQPLRDALSCPMLLVLRSRDSGVTVPGT